MHLDFQQNCPRNGPIAFDFAAWPAGWRCLMGIAAGRVAGAALCHGDCYWACRVGGAVPWGLLTRASSGWRRVFGIADQGLVWVAPCLWDC